MKSLVIDVRNNPGGPLDSAVEVADRFVEAAGIIVSTRGRNIQEDRTYSARDQGKWRLPLVVMVDQDTASAAEIFAGAIRDHHRGKIVGVRSFGKGSVQEICPLEESNAGVKLTVAKFYSPSGRPVSGIGIEPDVVVRSAARPIDGKLPAADEDAMLTAALQTARSLTQTLQARSGCRATPGRRSSSVLLRAKSFSVARMVNCLAGGLARRVMERKPCGNTAGKPLSLPTSLLY